MRSLRIIFIGLALLCASLSALGAVYKPLTEAQAAEAIQKIDASCAGIKSLKADFKQVKDIAILNEKMVSTGKMWFSGGMLRWEYVSPYTYLFILNKEKRASAEQPDIQQDGCELEPAFQVHREDHYEQHHGAGPFRFRGFQGEDVP